MELLPLYDPVLGFGRLGLLLVVFVVLHRLPDLVGTSDQVDPPPLVLTSRLADPDIIFCRQ